MSIEQIIQDVIREENERILSEIKKLISSSQSDTPAKPMTLDDACAYLSCSKSYLYKMTSGNKIPHSKRGKRLFFQKERLDEWLTEHKVKTVTEISEDVKNELINRKQKQHDLY